MTSGARARRLRRFVQFYALVAVASCATAVHAADPSATAPTKQQCADAYVAGQVARKEGKLRQAETEWRLCAQAACAEFLRRDCARWGDEVRAAVPTLAFDVRDAQGQQIADATVEIDGAPAEGAARGLAIPVDPGRHRVVARARDRYVEQEVIAIEGGRAQRVLLTFAADDPAEVVTSAPAKDTAPLAVERPSYVAPTVAGVIALGGFAGFTVFGLLANDAERQARATCINTCSDETVHAIWRKQLAADASLVVGAVAAGVAGWLLWQRRTPAVTPEVSLVGGSAVAAIGGRW